MVSGNVAYALQEDVLQEVEVSESPLKFCTVTLSDVISRGKRLEASVFDVESMQAYQTINHGKYPAVPLIGDNSPVKRAYYGARLKRNYVEANYPNAVGFVGSSEMLDCYPQPVKFMEDIRRKMLVQSTHHSPASPIGVNGMNARKVQEGKFEILIDDTWCRASALHYFLVSQKKYVSHIDILRYMLYNHIENHQCEVCHERLQISRQGVQSIGR